MTSLQTTTKQVGAATAYYIPVGDIRTQIYGFRTDLNIFSTSAWAIPGAAAGVAAGGYSTLVANTANSAAGLLKDMGKTIVSSTWTFRKVQLVVPGAGRNSTFGVAGDSATANGDYLSGYIAIGAEGGSVPTRVAKFGM